MEAYLKVENHIQCKIEIESRSMPPSFNLIKHIILQEGFGYAVPILQLNLMDATGSLQNDLNLIPGTLCKITLSRDVNKDPTNELKAEFSLWSVERYTDSEGPALKVLFILNFPKWTAGVYCENFRTTSSDVMGQLAGRSGLRYSGPKGNTDDRMNWLNINTTRSSFSEDVAIRGYKNQTSCMMRAVTLDQELRYKDLFEEIQQSEKATLLLNKEPTGINPITMKETTDTSLSTVFSHWFNYGQVQYEHTLDEKGQQETKKLSALVISGKLPVNMAIKGELDEKTGARVTYTGWDSGTEPKPQSDVHTYYEKAFYQNLRGLGLWGERIRSMTTFSTGLNTFDCIKYIQRDPDGSLPEPVDSRSRNGKYLVAGKTIKIKNGHNYVEVIDLVRPYVNETGGATSSNQGATKEPGNVGVHKMVQAAAAERQITRPATTSESAGVGNANTTSAMDRTATLLKDLLAFDVAVPKIPSTPLLPSGSTTSQSSVAVAQQNIIDSLLRLMATDNPVSTAINTTLTGINTANLATVKRIAATMIVTSANETIGSIIEAAAKGETNIQGLSNSILNNATAAVAVEKPLLDRYSDTIENILNESITSVIPIVASNDISLGDFIGDLNAGGVFSQTLLDNGITNIADIANAVNLIEISATDQLNNLGTNFLLPADQFSIGPGDVAVNPNKVSTFLVDSLSNINANTLLKDFGAKNYREMFGDVAPDVAINQVKTVLNLANDVVNAFDPNEVLAGTGVSGVFGRVSGAIGDVVDNAAKAVDIFGNVIDIAGRPIAATLDDITDTVEDAVKPALHVAKTLLLEPVVALRNTVSGVQEVVNEVNTQVNAVTEATKKQMLFDDPNLTVKVNVASTPAGLTMASAPVRRASKNLLAQDFSFQFGSPGIEPLVEKVVNKTIDYTNETLQNVAVFETTKEPISWSTFTRIGSNKAVERSSGNYWDFPHEDPFIALREGDGHAYSIS